MDSRPFLLVISNPVDVTGLINSLRNDGTIAIKLPDADCERIINALETLDHC